MAEAPFPADQDAWRQTHLGRLLGHAMRRFDERVLELMLTMSTCRWPCRTSRRARR